MTKHKHYDVLIAIAEGREVQFLIDGEWFDYEARDVINPLKFQEKEWRVKPVPKEPEYLHVAIDTKGNLYLSAYILDEAIGRIKLEALDD